MSTLNESRESAQVLGISGDYVILAGWVNFLWILYPIAFGLGDVSGVLGVNGSSIFFGVLDVLLLPVAGVGSWCCHGDGISVSCNLISVIIAACDTVESQWILRSLQSLVV